MVFGRIAVNAQEIEGLVPDSVKSEVTKLLKEYEFYHNSLTQESEPDIEISFLRLFANPKILVISDFMPDSVTNRVSIQDYSSAIIENFPQGVTVRLLYSSLMMGKPHYDRNDRYILRARIKLAKTGIINGKVLSSSKAVIFRIAFTWTGNQAIDYKIFGIEEAQVQRNVVGISGGPSLSTLTNSDLSGDNRFQLVYRTGYQASASFSHFFNPNWGLSAGIGYGLTSSALRLDSIDPYGGFNPGFSDVVFSNRLWHLSLPVLVSWQQRLTKRWTAYADAGPVISIRLFETQQVSGFSNSRGITMNNIISDPDWIPGLNRFAVNITADAGFLLQINPYMELGAGIRFTQGLTSVDHHYHYNYQAAKYLGQFNPLWGSDKVTAVRSAGFNIRINYTLKNASEK